MKIPHFDWNHRRLTEDVRPVESDRKARPKKGEFAVSGFQVSLPEMEECVSVALDDLKNTLRILAGDRIGQSKTVPLEIVIRSRSGRDRGYRMTLIPAGIRLEAETAFGAARALYRLRARLCLRRAPFLKTGTFDNQGSLDPALTYPAFKSVSIFSLDYPQAYPEGYLRKIARALYTGFHLNLHYSVFCRSHLLPELNDPSAEKNLAELNRIIRLAAKFGLEVYLSYYSSPLPGSHPVFQRLPEIRGSRMIGGEDSFVLCNSHPLVRKFYAENLRDLFSAAPGLGGVLTISGCEGWLHCHTACAQTVNGLCDCPRCREIEPEKSVAEMFNVMAAAVKSAAPQARLIVWNYGIFAWSDIGAERFISYLSKDCSVMANFDTGDAFGIEGVQGMAFDYSLRCTGPSQPYRKQQSAAARKTLNFLAKCESGAPLEYCSLNYVPAMTRWMRKFEGIRSSAAGALYNWKFLGYNEGMAQELAGLSSAGEDSTILKRLAAREFGSANVSALMRAWRAFDRAMDHHPFSGPSAGYFKGPFFIGPAQPLFLKVPARMPECLCYNRNPNQFLAMTDLTFAEPFGVQAMLRTLEKMLCLWRQGTEVLDSLRGEDRYQRSALKTHRALCNMFLCFLETARNMTDFYAVRDSLHFESYTPEIIRGKLIRLKEIACSELTNAEKALMLLRSDRSLGFSAVYPPGITEEMLEYKIEHTRKLLKIELPFKLYSTLFSFNLHPEWNL